MNWRDLVALVTAQATMLTMMFMVLTGGRVTQTAALAVGLAAVVLSAAVVVARGRVPDFDGGLDIDPDAR